MTRMRVVVGMSGGVDSSVTAALLQKQGFSVEGVSLQLWDRRGSCGEAACCSLESAQLAGRVAEILGIPHRVVDARGPFVDQVITPFAQAYRTGKTPNPCVLCNERVKFPLLLESAGRDGKVATGHYARVQCGAKGPCSLLCGIDARKDQAYFLYSVGRETLRRLVLPLGDYDKGTTRTIARDLGLPVAERPESQEICFVGDEGYARFLGDLGDDGPPGPIVNTAGDVLGTHQGIARYTVGQRKGLGISSSTPLYVVRIDAARNTVTVGERHEAEQSEFFVAKLCWLVDSPPPPGRPVAIAVRIRSMTPPQSARLEVVHADRVRIRTADPVWAPAPGQAAVFYDGPQVIGGGEIL